MSTQIQLTLAADPTVDRSPPAPVDRAFVEEREAVFGRGWLYVGHNAEIPGDGDYRRRSVGGRPVFLVRGNDGEPRVFFNTCTHRGALVCRQDQGSAATFQCFYHAWTFDNRGELVGVPKEEAYGPGWDRSELALRSPARSATLAGLHLVSYDPQGPELDDHLGDGRERLMQVCSPFAEHARVRGHQRFAVAAHWSLLVQAMLDDLGSSSQGEVPWHYLYPNLFVYDDGDLVVSRVEAKASGDVLLSVTVVGAQGRPAPTRTSAGAFNRFPGLSRIEELEAVQRGESDSIRVADASRASIDAFVARLEEDRQMTGRPSGRRQ